MAESVGDIMIRFRVEASNVAQQMNNIKKQVQDTANSVKKTVQTNTKSVTGDIDSTGTQLANTTNNATSRMKKFNQGFRDGITYASEGLKEARDQTVTTANSVQKAGRQIQQTGQNIKKTLKGDVALAFAAVGGAALSFAKNCVSAAITSEKEWTRFGALVNQGGGDWDKQEKSVKGWARTFSNQMGYSVSDTREASLTLMQAGLRTDQLGTAMNGVAALAARTGKTEAEAANMVVSAMNGRGTALKKATGINLEDYKVSKGKYDMMRLLTDIYKENDEALRKHADTTEAQMTRVQNAWDLMKVEIGQALMPTVKMLADILWTIADAFSKLPEPVKQAVAGFLLIGGAIAAVLGVVGFLAPGITAIGTVLAALSGPVIAVVAVFAVLAAGLYAIYASSTELQSALGELASVLGSAFMSALSGAVDWLGQVWVAVKPVAQWIGDKLAGGIRHTVEQIGPLQNAVGRLQGAFDRLWHAFDTENGNLLVGIFDGLKTVVMAAVPYLDEFFDILVENTSTIDFVIGLVEGLASIIETLAGWVEGAGEALGRLKGFFDDVSAAIQKACEWWDTLTGKKAPEMPGQGQQKTGATAQTQQTSFKLPTQQGLNAIPGFGGANNMIAQMATNILPQASQLGSKIGSRLRLGLSGSLPSIRTTLTNIGNTIGQRLGLIANRSGPQGRQIGNNVSNGIKTVNPKARSTFDTLKGIIGGRLSSAASTASTEGHNISHNTTKDFPQVGVDTHNEFDNIKNIVSSALSAASAIAGSGAAAIVSAFRSGLQRASPGKIYWETYDEFWSLPTIIMGSGVVAAREAGTAAQSIVRTWRNNMETLAAPTMESMDGLEQFNSFNDLTRRNINTMANNMDIYKNGVFDRFVPTNKVTNNDHTVVYNVEKITLECAELTQAQSRQVLYNALDGLYTGGV